MEIKNLTFTDWSQVQAIYESGIATGHATFEMQSPNWESWDKSRLPFCRFVVCEDEQVLAWAALSPVSSRALTFQRTFKISNKRKKFYQYCFSGSFQGE